MAALSSCQKQDVYVVESPLNTVLVTVEENQWAYSNVDNNNYFYATVDMPEITQSVFKTGLVKVYRVYDFNTSNATQIEMPYVRHKEYYSTEDDRWDFYTETCDYEFNVGQMTICYTLSDFYYELDESFWPERMQFRCVIME